MLTDSSGNPTTAHPSALQPFEQALDDLLHFRGDLIGDINHMVEADPGCAMGHAFKGYIGVLGTEAEDAAVAKTVMDAYLRQTDRSKFLEREQMHLQAASSLLYVGASRARDVLLLSGSVKQGKPTGWAEALSQIGFGPEAVAYERSDYVQQTHAYRYVPEYEPTHQNKTVEIPPWLDQTFAPNPYPPLFSPSALKKEEAAPLPLPDLEEGEEVPGRARAVGTLVHYAIGQNWNLAEQEQKDNLEAQEVMFPFDPSERDSIMAEVGELLASYERLKGSALPWPRDEDYPEYPLVLPLSHTVWQGVIDRLYRVGQEWYLEDYKTDLEVDPQRYHLQLALYREAIHRAWNIEPQVRLVYLRFGELHEIGEGELRAALDEVIKP
jgi:ATP-dependent exoDNAse (exonuclease V) beta subunit